MWNPFKRKAVAERKLMFVVPEDELVRYEAWNKAHLEERHNGKEPRSGAIGGRVSFIFTSTSLGHITSVECSCGAKECLTDFKDW